MTGHRSCIGVELPLAVPQAAYDESDTVLEGERILGSAHLDY